MAEYTSTRKKQTKMMTNAYSRDRYCSLTQINVQLFIFIMGKLGVVSWSKSAPRTSELIRFADACTEKYYEEHAWKKST